LEQNTTPNNTALGFQTLHVSDSSPNNTAIGSGALTSLTGRGNNTALGANCMCYSTETLDNPAVGYVSAEGVSSATDNVCVGCAAGNSITSGTRNLCIGSNCNVYSGVCTSSIVLGSRVNASSPNVVNTANNQLYIAPSITSFNISGLTASTGSREGTILEFDSSGNIIPAVGTYNTVSKIDTDISTLLLGGTVFTTSGSYTVPLNITTLTIEAMGRGSGATGSENAWSGGGGRSGALEKITIPATSRQVINFTIGVGGAGGGGSTQSGGNGTATTITMYGQTILTANGGLGSTGINGL